MFIKRIAIYALMLLVALIVSCGRHRLVVHDFVDEPQDASMATHMMSIFRCFESHSNNNLKNFG